MKTLVILTTILVGLLSPLTRAAAPAGAPAGATGLCNDGSYSSGPTKKGACRGHKGVKEWYGAQSSPAQAAPTATPATPASTAATKPAAAPAPAPTTTVAAAGGVGKVWVNKSTKVYHCPGDRWYGKTKQGEFMSEADARAAGFKPDRNKPCK